MYITTKKMALWDSWNLAKIFVRPIVFEALHCVRQPFHTPFYNNQSIITLFSSIDAFHSLGSNNSSLRQAQPRPSKQTRITNGDVKSRRKGAKSKSKAAAEADLVLSSSSDTDLSLTTLDVSSPSDTELTSVKLDRSHRGIYLFEIKMTFTHLTYFCKKTDFCYNKFLFSVLQKGPII